MFMNNMGLAFFCSGGTLLSSLFGKSNDECVYAPIDGAIIPLEKVNDTTFSEGLLGPGIGINPTSDTIYSPIDGEITVVFPTKHAICLKRKDGLDLMVHIGIDTVNLQGKGFQLFVQKGQKVKKGTKLVKFDKALMQKENYDMTIMLIVLSKEDFEITFADKDKVKKKEPVYYAKKK